MDVEMKKYDSIIIGNGMNYVVIDSYIGCVAEKEKYIFNFKEFLKRWIEYSENQSQFCDRWIELANNIFCSLAEYKYFKYDFDKFIKENPKPIVIEYISNYETNLMNIFKYCNTTYRTTPLTQLFALSVIVNYGCSNIDYCDVNGLINSEIKFENLIFNANDLGMELKRNKKLRQLLQGFQNVTFGECVNNFV